MDNDAIVAQRNSTFNGTGTTASNEAELRNWRLRVSLDAGRYAGVVLLGPPDTDEGRILAVIDAITGSVSTYANIRPHTKITEVERTFAVVSQSLHPVKVKQWRDSQQRYYDMIDMTVPLRGQADALGLIKCVADTCVATTNALPANYEVAARAIAKHLLNALAVERMHESPMLGVTSEARRQRPVMSTETGTRPKRRGTPLANLMRRRRWTLRRTLDQMAERSGLSKSTLWELESRVQLNPRLTTVLAVCAAYGFSIAAIAHPQLPKAKKRESHTSRRRA